MPHIQSEGTKEEIILQDNAQGRLVKKVGASRSCGYKSGQGKRTGIQGCAIGYLLAFVLLDTKGYPPDGAETDYSDHLRTAPDAGGHFTKESLDRQKRQSLCLLYH